eukprot:CAMPEP_0170472308 /NCGR_PEP_ID=MMETSP0123-20130129/14364_1 /TAXON_ID=182087 /ORGANISM="Favella ehrenbergii, Strain Fehren 1" /LENGTH=362 /DNA_ID=CAMNT_0010740499 /DNA_START=595 /DNA_END=1684 /DNA_ORIENTATION=+
MHPRLRVFPDYGEEGLREPINGVLGLSRDKPYYLADESRKAQSTRGPSYLHALKNAEIITEATVSFKIAPFGFESEIDFGPPKEDRIRKDGEMKWINVNDDFFWSASCLGFAIGTQSNGWQWGSIVDAEKTVSYGQVYSIFDTGSSSVIIPADYFESYLALIYEQMEGDEFEVASGYVLTKCYEDFPNLYFLFDGRWLALHPADYLVDVSESQDRSMCVLLLSPGSQSFIVMGLPAYMNYYTVHEDVNNRIGFAPHTTSDKDDLKRGKQPKRVLESLRPAPEFGMGAASLFIVLFIIVFFMTVWILLVYEISKKSDTFERPACFCLAGILVIAIFAMVMLYSVRPLVDDLINGEPKYARSTL